MANPINHPGGRSFASDMTAREMTAVNGYANDRGYAANANVDYAEDVKVDTLRGQLEQIDRGAAKADALADSIHRKLFIQEPCIEGCGVDKSPEPFAVQEMVSSITRRLNSLQLRLAEVEARL